MLDQLVVRSDPTTTRMVPQGFLCQESPLFLSDLPERYKLILNPFLRMQRTSVAALSKALNPELHLFP